MFFLLKKPSTVLFFDLWLNIVEFCDCLLVFANLVVIIVVIVLTIRNT